MSTGLELPPTIRSALALIHPVTVVRREGSAHHFGYVFEGDFLLLSQVLVDNWPMVHDTTCNKSFVSCACQFF